MELEGLSQGDQQNTRNIRDSELTFVFKNTLIESRPTPKILRYLRIDKRNPTMICYLNGQISTNMFRFCCKNPGLPGQVFRTLLLPEELIAGGFGTEIEETRIEPTVLVYQVKGLEYGTGV